MSQTYRPPFSFEHPSGPRVDETLGESPDRPTALNEDNDLEELDPDAPATGGREGLPSSFRMRADAHYVEHITRESISPLILRVPVGEIDVPSPVSRADIEPLAESVAEFGVLQPLLVRRRRGRFELIAGARRLAAALEAGLRTVPCLLHEVDDEGARALAAADNLHHDGRRVSAPAAAMRDRLVVAGAAQFAESANTLATCLGLIDARGRPRRERLAVDLMRGEARRAAWQARACAVLAGEVRVRPGRMRAALLLETASEAVRLDPRLSGTSVAVTSPNGAGLVAADRELLSVGVAGLLLGLVLALRSQGVATPSIEARAGSAHGLLWLDLVQRQASIGVAALSAIARGDAWSWPGGPEAVIGMATARGVATLHEGRLDGAPIKPRGCRLSLGLPRLG